MKLKGKYKNRLFCGFVSNKYFFHNLVHFLCEPLITSTTEIQSQFPAVFLLWHTINGGSNVSDFSFQVPDILNLSDT